MRRAIRSRPGFFFGRPRTGAPWIAPPARRSPAARVHRSKLASWARMRPIRALAPVRARLQIDGYAPSRARRRLRLGTPRIPICFVRSVDPGLSPSGAAQLRWGLPIERSPNPGLVVQLLNDGALPLPLQVGDGGDQEG